MHQRRLRSRVCNQCSKYCAFKLGEDVGAVKCGFRFSPERQEHVSFLALPSGVENSDKRERGIFQFFKLKV